MADQSFEEFHADRAALQARLQQTKHLGIKRVLTLDTAAYRDGALPGRTKEMLGLTASMVLRCDDCINYHLEQAVRAEWKQDEIEEAMNVALIVGGSIVIPHLRRAVRMLDELLALKKAGKLGVAVL